MVIIVARASMMHQEFEAAVEKEPADGMRWRTWTFLNLWLACLAVVAEGWETSWKRALPLTDPEIDILIQSPFRRQLRSYRNAIFHPDYYDAAAIRDAFDQIHPFAEWAEQLTAGFRRYFSGHLKRMASAS